ncbi:hypothetical protein [Streptomyces sp. NPDC046939]|uniref:hypothetical protein n=1 Tax=Streptomyces sp. NPDC046939 TaxID=3155376 RepID=UPI0033CDF0AC
MTQDFDHQTGGPLPAHGFGPPPPMYAPPVPATGPEFVAADDFNGIVVDAVGIHFEQGPHSIELPWARLHTVRFHPLGDGLSVTAVTVEGPVYECRVRARKRSLVPRWCTDLSGVLHHYLGARG